jgi:hypothetical protein
MGTLLNIRQPTKAIHVLMGTSCADREPVLEKSEISTVQCAYISLLEGNNISVSQVAIN